MVRRRHRWAAGWHGAHFVDPAETNRVRDIPRQLRTACRGCVSSSCTMAIPAHPNAPTYAGSAARVPGCRRSWTADMELANPELIDALLHEPKPIRPVRIRRAPAKARAGVRVPLASKAPRPTCVCGRCAECEENARWDRVFKAKFADPKYYRPRPPRRGSPTAGM